MLFMAIYIGDFCYKTKNEVILQCGFVRFCSPMRLEFLAHAFFCLLWKMSPHLCVVAVGKVDTMLLYFHVILQTKHQSKKLIEFSEVGDVLPSY